MSRKRKRTQQRQQQQQHLEEAARHETVMDVGTERVAKVYAAALMKAAGGRKADQEVLEEFESLVRDVLDASPQLGEFLHSSAVGRKEKEAVLRRTFEGRASDLLLNFLLVVNDHERLGLLHEILTAYRALYERERGLLRVEVTSAAPLADDQREHILRDLKALLRSEPVLETRVDPELLGGLTVRVGDWLYDASVRSQLATIRNQILEKGSHEIQSRRDYFSTV